MKRAHLNIGLLVIVAGLGVAVWFGQKKAEEKKPPLTSVEKAAVTSIAIEHPGSPAIRLAKQNGVWMLTAPVQAETDPFEVNALVGLADTGVQQTLAAVDLKELGLAPARYRITLNEHSIDFGGEEPLKYRRYVLVDGKQIELIDDPGSAAFDADYSDLVAKNLLPASADITRIAAPGLSIEKTAGGVWLSPDHPQARPEQLLAVITAWKNAKALFNAAIDPEDAKAEPVTLTLSDGRTLGFNIVSRDPQLVLSRADLGVRYTLSKADIDMLLKLGTPAPAAKTQTP
ncbi:MAG: hypothetical protein JWQ90_759 [Hydrocarboniphaga sp.]|uniref:DUF4340 domain-containing protein n=1 Tax=Hydrocarboniphaga sp. TaxID=2033016 RepID=UPI002620DC67|nr:DUF4340 domain-containing protein [Hydrocarboniphaga sp.]MDB5968309.1 hypothetical protein [Hydrocarboniphaga sp.]